MVSPITIHGRKIGPGFPVYIVAEMSANHGQDFEQAVRLVHAAKEAGADALKIQTYTPDTITIDSDRDCFRVGEGSLWAGRNLYQLYREAHTPWSWQPGLKAIANSVGLDLFSTPFDDTAVDFLERLETPVHKIASFELVDLPLIRKVARTGKPIIISTGMATLAEIQEALACARKAGATDLALLKCTSAYPAPAEEMHLRTIPHMMESCGIPVGLSDHTLGLAVPVAAVALGASIVEKHITISRSHGGPDSAFSLEPQEFKAMVDAVRAAETALGAVHYGAGQHESQNLVFRRSLFVVKDMKRGEAFTPDNVRSIRPGHGLACKHYDNVLGRAAAADILRGTPLGWDLVSPKPSAK